MNGIGRSVSKSTKRADKATIYARISMDVKEQLEDYAAGHGITVAAAAEGLLSASLAQAAGQPTRVVMGTKAAAQECLLCGALVAIGSTLHGDWHTAAGE